MRALMTCAVHAPDLVRKSDIARVCNGSEAHFGLIVNQLAQTGLICTVRGRRGGLKLALPADEIVVGHVFRLFESSVPFTECFAGGEDDCPIKSACRLRGALERALEAFYAELDKVTLADLVHGNSGLGSLLAFPVAEARSGPH